MQPGGTSSEPRNGQTERLNNTSFLSGRESELLVRFSLPAVAGFSSVKKVTGSHDNGGKVTATRFLMHKLNANCDAARTVQVMQATVVNYSPIAITGFGLSM